MLDVVILQSVDLKLHHCMLFSRPKQLYAYCLFQVKDVISIVYSHIFQEI